MTIYGIEKTLNEIFPAGDAHSYLLDRIQESAPDFFEESDLEMASEIEEGKRKYFPKEEDECETIECVSSSHRK